MARPDRGQLTARYTFPLDRFQIEAMDFVDAGDSVVVAAPTGSGKTVVAEYGIASALADGRRAFYTAPIKALSNQKFMDLMAVHGRDRVGLLTGDNAVNPDAPIVVMTTEVLRNMIYARSSALADLKVVVLDEVHFIQDGGDHPPASPRSTGVPVGHGFEHGRGRRMDDHRSGADPTGRGGQTTGRTRVSVHGG